MMNVIEQLKEVGERAVKDLYGQGDVTIQLNETRKEFEGDYTLVCFPLTRIAKKKPEETAEEIGNYFTRHCDIVAQYNVVKGFLNLSLKDEVWIQFLKEVPGSDQHGQLPTNGQKVMVEYSSPNTNKPLHLGHIRNNLLGYSVSEILKSAGFEVTKANLINDRGIHICKSMLAWQKFGNGETPESSGMKGDHLVGKYYVEFDKHYKTEINELVEKGMPEKEARDKAPILVEAKEMLVKWEQGDPEVRALWEKMNSWVYKGFDVTYKNLGVNFDKYYYESDTYLLGKSIIEEGLEKGIFHKKEDGSVWIDLQNEGLDEKLLLRSDGTAVYMTQDIGTAQLKYDDYKMDQSLYVVGNEQDYHFKVLKLIVQKLNKPYADGIYHLSYGMVDLPEGKMKSREGTVVDADDLIQEMIDTAREHTLELGKIEAFSDEEAEELYKVIGLGALKFFLLKVDPKKRILFNPKESIDFQGHTGPFVQYTHARIKSVLRKYEALKDEHGEITVAKLEPEEREVLKNLYKFPEVVQEAASQYDPSVIANYVYELAKIYNKFYARLPILKCDDATTRHFRIQLCGLTAQILKSGMALLGISVPDRM